MTRITPTLLIALSLLPATALLAQVKSGEKSAEKTTEPILVLEKVVAEKKLTDPINLLDNEPVDSVFGFKKSLMETPRALSVLSDDVMTAYGIESALDVTSWCPARSRPRSSALTGTSTCAACRVTPTSAG